MTYRPRLTDGLIERALRISPAVNVTGPRACGKTTSALQLARSSLRLDPANQALLARTVDDPYGALAGDEPRLLDEWQLVPTVWDAVRREVDRDNRRGRFLLSGSAWPSEDETRHSGAGRILSVPMRPMSLAESGRSTGAVSLGALLRGAQEPVSESGPEVSAYADAIVVGGWPGWYDIASQDAQVLVEGYLENLAEHEFPLVGGARRAPERFSDFIRAYATLTAHPAPLSTVGQRLAVEGVDVGKDYPGLFHSFARRMYLVEDQPAWRVSVRSRARLVANPKRHLVDPSLAAAAMGLSADGLLADWETFGFLFESLAVRDLRIYAQTHDAKVMHFRTSDGGAEIDAIVEFRDRKWMGVEVKLGFQAGEKAAFRLAEVAALMDRPPAALAVIVGGLSSAFQLSNGVWIVPLAMLGP